MESESETRLCNVCQNFYGRQETNFLCSGCFRKSHKTQSPSKNVFHSHQTVREEIKEVPSIPIIEETEQKESQIEEI